MNTSFSFGAMISTGWTTFKKHWKFIVLAGIVTVIIEGVLKMLSRSWTGHPVLVIFVSVVSLLISIVIGLGWIRVLLSLNRSGSATWKTFETDSKTWVRAIKIFIWYILYFLYYILIGVLPFGILALIGFLTHVQALTAVGGIIAYVIFIVIAIYLGIKYQFMYYVMLDNPTLRSRAVFKKAGDLTQGNLLELLGFGIVLLLYNLVGLICLVVGLIVTIPVSKLAKAKVYDYLKNKNHEHASHAPEVSHQN